MFIFLITSKQAFFYDNLDKQREFTTNFGISLQVGYVIGALSTSKDSLFLDGTDDIIYFIANRQSKYPYSWYTSLMPNFNKYSEARIKMFHKNPPDFYYGSCPKETSDTRLIPDFIRDGILDWII